LSVLGSQILHMDKVDVKSKRHKGADGLFVPVCALHPKLWPVQITPFSLASALLWLVRGTGRRWEVGGQ
jgi:hypothetical protein